MKVVRVKYDKNPAWCMIYIDNGEFFRVSTDLVLKYALAAGAELTLQSLTQLQKDQRAIDAKQTAYNYAAYKPRTARQLKDKLRLAGYSPDEISDALEFLNNFALVDDTKYAGSFVRDYLIRKQVSKEKLRSELFKKGISSAIANNAIEENYPNENEYNFALKSAQKKMKLIERKPKNVQKAAMAAELRKQGFNPDTIRYVIEDIFSGTDDGQFIE